MKTLPAVLIAAAMVLYGASAFGADADSKPRPAEKKEASGLLINYKPRAGSIGKPSLRVGGATRGITMNVVSITALAPDHTGLTISEQPALCWHLSGKAKTRLGITINDETSARPLFEKEFEDNSEEGIRCISLSEYGVSLAPGVEYQWFAAIINDPEQRSKDIVSSGMIKRIPSDRALSAKVIAAHSSIEKVMTFASEGIWYDALSLLSGLIEKSPEDKKLRIVRAELLEQAGLSKAAASDRR